MDHGTATQVLAKGNYKDTLVPVHYTRVWSSAFCQKVNRSRVGHDPLQASCVYRYEEQHLLHRIYPTLT